jgi:hypothetical protein
MDVVRTASLPLREIKAYFGEELWQVMDAGQRREAVARHAEGGGLPRPRPEGGPRASAARGWREAVRGIPQPQLQNQLDEAREQAGRRARDQARQRAQVATAKTRAEASEARATARALGLQEREVYAQATARREALLELALSDSGEDDGGGEEEEEEDDTFSTLSTLLPPDPTPLAAADTRGDLNLAHLSDDQRVHLHELIGLHQSMQANYARIAAHPSTDVAELHATLESLSRITEAHTDYGAPPTTLAPCGGPSVELARFQAIWTCVAPAAVRSACDGGHKLGQLLPGTRLTVLEHAISATTGVGRLRYAMQADAAPDGMPRAGWVSEVSESGKQLLRPDSGVVATAPPKRGARRQGCCASRDTRSE